MTASVMTTTGGPESSDDCLRDTVTGDAKLPPPTAVSTYYTFACYGTQR